MFLFLETDDFARDHAAYESQGVRFIETPRTEPDGIVTVFKDIYSNRWDLIKPSNADLWSRAGLSRPETFGP